MKIRIPFILLTIFLLTGFHSSAQERIERQHRIKKSQFPSEALEIISNNSSDIKRLKFYREVDTAQKTYTAKFKRSRLFYEMDFDKNGDLKSMGFNIKQVDIPEESFEQISNYLLQNFDKSKVRKMFQLYPHEETEDLNVTIKSAFQNLIQSSILYKIVVRGKKEGKPADYIITFDSEGYFKEIRKSLPANYDRVLY